MVLIYFGLILRHYFPTSVSIAILIPSPTRQSSPTQFNYHESKVKQEFQTNGNHLFSVSEIFHREPTVSILEEIVKLVCSHDTTRRLTINKVLRVNHVSQILNRFESFVSRENKIPTRWRKWWYWKNHNEVLKFHGTIITCSFGIDGCTLICDVKSCGLRRFITSFFSAKTTGPMLVSEDGWEVSG